MKIVSTQEIKKLNKGIIRGLLKRVSIATKPELAKMSGLSVVTVNNLLHELVESGECFEVNHADSTGGRPALRFKYNPGFRIFLTICLAEYQGKETINLSICDLNGDILKESFHQYETVDMILLDNLINNFIIEYPHISLIYVGIPGVEIKGSFLIMDFFNMKQDNLRKHLEQTYNVPILIENDVNAAIFGDSLETKKTFNSPYCSVGLYYPSKNPPGMGVVINGELFRGKNGLVGEIQNSSTPNIWNESAMTGNKLEEHIIQSIIVIQSLFDPDDLVLYGEYFNDDLIKKSLTQLNSIFPNIELPNIKIVSDFYADYIRGLNALALTFIESEINNNN